MTQEPSFTLGMEEEYLLVDPATRDLAADPPASLLDQCQRELGTRAGPEFMRCQIEVGTRVCRSIAALREDLAHLRRDVAEIAARHDLRVIAASTHPFGTWLPQKTTQRDRYTQLAEDIGIPLRRLLICAMHVHVGIEDPNLRIDLMNQARYFLPHLLALSTSSPFWQGNRTGLKSYRLAVFSELPRTGIPERFESFSDYEQHVEALVHTGTIEDATKLWWDIRPSARFPTLEMRVCDICTRMSDGITIAALFVCILRMLWRRKCANLVWRNYKLMLISENRWRAMRYGADGGLIDFGRRTVVPYPDLVEELLDMVEEDAAVLGCLAEIDNARAILRRGTSAHSQQQVYDDAIAQGHDRQAALNAVVDWLIETTAKEIEVPIHSEV